METTETRTPLKTPRRQQILEALATQLEAEPGKKITTAKLARHVGVTEAALYRHFPSKARIYEGLIEFAEESVFGLVNQIMEDDRLVAARIDRIMRVVLGFADRNPGIARMLHGDVLTGEQERLSTRVSQFNDRIETQLRQALRESRMEAGVVLGGEVEPLAEMLLAILLGRVDRFVSSGFKRRPLSGWDAQWLLVSAMLLPPRD